MKISSKVSRGPFKGEVQEPWISEDGFYALTSCPVGLTREPNNDAHYVLVRDLQSVANGLRAGLRLRMVSPSVEPSIRKAPDILIDGYPVSAFDPPKRK